MFPEWTWIVGLLIGAAFGSFLNVVIYRMPLGLSLNEPKNSFCPICKNRLTILDLFPLFSWLFLRGKCRHCKAPIPARYFFVEVITGSLWAVVWYQQMIMTWNVPLAVLYFAMISALVAATYIDLRWFIIPDQINAFLLVIGLGYNGYLIATNAPNAWMWGMPISIAGALLGWVILWGITFLGRILFGKDAMGHGDIKLARGMGACLMPLGVGMAVAIAVIAGSFLGIIQALVRKGLQEAEPEPEGEEEEYQPETIGSVIKCGIGYLLCFDVIGLFIPKFYKNYFGEDPYAAEDPDDEWNPGWTHIPFGPYLALGAIGYALFQPQLYGVWQAYLRHLGIQ
jgi:leader peptidase (prepilin peptidase)/N-methyltransferase